MATQLTVQTPLQLPPSEITSYLDQLWSNDDNGNIGANTFSLLVYQPAWIEQKLICNGKIDGPILGNLRKEIIEAARSLILEKNLPLSTAPLDDKVITSISTNLKKNISNDDLRGQHIDNAISDLKPRRIITLAPTLQDVIELETSVSAYCPLLEEGGGNTACGDAIVFRGGLKSLKDGLDILENLIPEDLPSWLWWNGSLDEAPKLLERISKKDRRLIIDSALGNPSSCLNFLNEKLNQEQAVNDLNWLRLRSWRETLAMVFDPPSRRDSLSKIISIDIDIEGDHPVQGLLLASWIADRLGWKIKSCNKNEKSSINTIEAIFSRKDHTDVRFRLVPTPIGNPNIHPGQIVGLRLISNSKESPENSICVILGSQSSECMKLEAGGMASMELVEEVVPNQLNTIEMDVARLLSSSRGNSSPLLARATPIAIKLLEESL